MSPEAPPASPKRITFVADELLGFPGSGGLGTATTFLAVALARLGHRVDLLFLGSGAPDDADPEWAQLYEQFGITVTGAPRRAESVEPTLFARMWDVDHALRAHPPDVVVVQDLAAPAYVSMRLRSLGLGFERTSFVVFCHGTRRWITDVSRKVRVLPGAHLVTVLEQASLELADVVVSPSGYMVDWMRGQGWTLPDETRVIPYLTRSGATGGLPAPPAGASSGRRVERIAFFGRFEDRKGLRPFIEALNSLDAELVANADLEFLGRPTGPWPVDRIEGLLTERTRRAFRSVSFETELHQHEALARLRRPGTLAVMPSLADNSPNTVYECLEHGIPFVTGDVGGAQELVAEEDRERVLCDPTPEGIAQALRRSFAGPLRPARRAFDDAGSLQRWSDVVTAEPSLTAVPSERPPVDVVVVHRESAASLSRCLAALAAQSDAEVRVLVMLAGPRVRDPEVLDAATLVLRSEHSTIERARAAALPALGADWVVFLDEDDAPEPDFVATLLRAQAAAGADVVSCGLFLDTSPGGRSIHLFPGEPQALGLLANGYGAAALIRRSLLSELAGEWPVAHDPDWPLLARLHAQGARIVCVPTPLLARRTRPGTLESAPSDALLVVEELERALPAPVAAAARLAAGLAADATHSRPQADGIVRSALGRLTRRFR